MADVRLWQFWNATALHLDTLRMGNLLGGSGRIRKVTDEMNPVEDGEEVVWGRVVLVPTQTLWPQPFVEGETRKVAFLVRAECHAPRGEPNFDAGRLLEAVQAEAYTLLQGWTPAPFVNAMVALPVYRQEAPQPLPLWDDTRGLWYTSSQYRTEFVSNPGG